MTLAREENMEYRYETHLHTSPVSRCATATVADSLRFYKSSGYDGVFITNHFLDGNINFDKSRPYRDKIEFYFSDAEEGERIGKQIALKVFTGVEMSDRGTDFLVYGLSKLWYLSHPGIMDMPYREKLDFLRKSGAFVVQAHPYREASYIDHIRLFPRSVDAVEVLNGANGKETYDLTALYAEHYGLPGVAGSDNHNGSKFPVASLAGIVTDEPILSVADYRRIVKSGKYRIFG